MERRVQRVWSTGAARPSLCSPQSLVESIADCSALGLPEHSIETSAVCFGTIPGGRALAAPSCRARRRRSGAGSTAVTTATSLRAAITRSPMRPVRRGRGPQPTHRWKASTTPTPQHLLHNTYSTTPTPQHLLQHLLDNTYFNTYSNTYSTTPASTPTPQHPYGARQNVVHTCTYCLPLSQGFHTAPRPHLHLHHNCTNFTPAPNTKTVSPTRGCASWTIEIAVSAEGRKTPS